MGAGGPEDDVCTHMCALVCMRACRGFEGPRTYSDVLLCARFAAEDSIALNLAVE